MFKRGFALLSLALLAGCVSGPVPIVYKPGSTFAQRQMAADACRIESIEKIPQTLVTEYEPPEYHPAMRECRTDPDNGRRYCRETGGFVYPGRSSTRDINAELRERYVASCLRRSGFDVIAKPICGSSDGPVYMSTRDNQPPAAALACVAEDERLIPREWR